jgi:hypothetical protein
MIFYQGWIIIDGISFFECTMFWSFVLIMNLNMQIYSCAADMLRNCDNFFYEQQKEVLLSSFNPKSKK